MRRKLDDETSVTLTLLPVIVSPPIGGRKPAAPDLPAGARRPTLLRSIGPRRRAPRVIDDPEKPEAEKPRSTPEILPPLGAGQRAGRHDDNWTYAGQGAEHIRVYRLGPFTAMALGFGVLAIAALLLFVFAGALLIALPVAAVMLLGSFLAFKFRNRFGR